MKYRVSGVLFQRGAESVCIFDANEAEAFLKPHMLPGGADPKSLQPLSLSGKRIRAVPKEWVSSFGKRYSLHQRDFPAVESQDEEDWKIRIEGQLYETGENLNVTGFHELRDYIRRELNCEGEEL